MPRLRTDVLAYLARQLVGQPVRVVAADLPPGVGGKARHDGRGFVIELSPRLFGDVPLLGHAFYHEVGHVRGGHVAAPNGINTMAAAPGSPLRALWAGRDAQHEREAEEYAAAKWAKLGKYADLIFGVMAFEDGDNE
jgi:hypothetical protein